MLDGVSNQIDQTKRQRALDAQSVDKGGEAPVAAPASPPAVARTPASPAAQKAARDAQAQRERAAAARVPGADPVASRPIPKLDPNKPVMIVATQSGGAESDSIVKSTDAYMKKQAQDNGFQVVNASNLSGDALKKYVAAVARANPKAFAGKNTVLFTGGHGDIMTNDKGQDRHQIAASEADHRARQVETVRDIVKPVFDGIKDATGAEQKVSAFVSSCRSGEAAQDVKEVFGDDNHVGLVASSTRDQNSFGPGEQGIEQAAIAFAKTMARSSKDRASADANHDGKLTIGEFAKHWNTSHGGLGFVDPGEEPSPRQPLVKRQQKLVVGGNPDLTLVPRDAGADHDTSSDGLKDATHAGPLQRDGLDAAAKRMQKEIQGEMGFRPRIARGFKTVEETGSDGKKKDLPDGSTAFIQEGGTVTETQHPDGSFDVKLPHGDSVHFDPDGKRTERYTRGPIAERVVDPKTGHREIGYRDGTREVREADGSGYLEKHGNKTALPVKAWPGTAPAQLPSPAPPDGEPKVSMGKHGEEIARYDDGTTVTTARDGSQAIAYPDSSPLSRSAIDEKTGKETLEFRDGPIKSLQRPLDGAPGTTTTTYRDGTREVRTPDGRGYFVLAGGHRVTLPIGRRH